MFASATLALALALAGCGRGSGGEGESLEESLGLDKAGIALLQIRVDEAVQACMRQAGFDYVPVDPTATKAALIGTSGLSDEEFTQQFGYGISTIFEKVIEVSRQSTNSADPNVAYRSSLDAAGQAAFDQALNGGNADVSVSGAVDAATAGNLEGLSGCVGDATRAVFGGANVLEALAKVEELDQRAEADPRILAAHEKWSACMRQEGFDYVQPDDVDGVMLYKLAAIVGPEAARPLGDAETFSPLAFPSAVRPYDTAALASLQQEEVATARADLECEEKHIAEVEARVKGEYERRFQEENAPLLERVRSRLEVIRDGTR